MAIKKRPDKAGQTKTEKGGFIFCAKRSQFQKGGYLALLLHF